MCASGHEALMDNFPTAGRMSLGDVRALAALRHRDALDAQGRSYYVAHLAPIAHVLSAFGQRAEMGGWLHDIVEDTEETPASLRARGVDFQVVTDVDAVSRRTDESGRKEPYLGGLIERACRRRSSALLKLVDNQSNILNTPALARLDPKRASSMLTKRYLPAQDLLLSAAGLSDAEVGFIRAEMTGFVAALRIASGETLADVESDLRASARVVAVPAGALRRAQAALEQARAKAEAVLQEGYGCGPSA